MTASGSPAIDGSLPSDIPPSGSDALQAQLQSEQVRLSVEQVRRIPPAHFLVDLFLTWNALQAGLGWMAWAWLGVMTVAQVGRTVIVLRRYGQGGTPPHLMLRWMGRLMAGLGLIHAGMIVLVFGQGIESREYVLTMVLVGNAAGAVSPSAGYLRGYLEWAGIYGGVLVLAWLSHFTVDGAAIALLIIVLFIILSLYVRDQGKALEDLVELSESLRIERDRAERASEARTRFFAAASHDLRQPLTALSYNAATVQALARSQGDGDLLKVSDAIRRALAESRNLLDSLLEMSQLDAGVVKAERRSVDPGVVLAEAEDAFSRLAEDKGLVLVIRPPPPAAYAFTDAALLRRILHNLIGNAIKFSTRGEVVVEALLSGDGRHLLYRVSDSGPGIAPAVQDKIFEEFFQVGNVERNRARGLGLGLAIVRRLASLIEAKIRLTSVEGQGSVFEIQLPRASAVPGMSAAADEAGGLHQVGAGRRVLIIDDEREVAEGLAVFLQTLGWVARGVPGKEEAIAAWSGGFAPHAVIVDFRLVGGATGLEVLSTLRSLGCHAPAWLVTGETEPSRIVAALDSGIPILYKPVDGFKLAAMLDAVLTRSSAAIGSGEPV